MKKILLKMISVLIVPFILLYLYILLFPMCYMNNEYPIWKQQKDYVNKNNDHNDVLIVGDSSAKTGILTSGFDGMNVYNISILSGTSVEIYVSLRNYLENHDAPGSVIMMFSVRDLISNGYLYDYILFFNYYSWQEMNEMYEKGQELNDPYWGSDIIKTYMLKSYLRDPMHYMTAVNNSGFFGRYPSNKKRYEQLENDRGWMIMGTNDENYDADYISELEHFEVLPMQDNYIRQIIELCEENDIEIIIEQAPIKESSRGMIRENVVSEFEEYFGQLQKDYPDAKIESTLVYYSNNYFTDVDHVNLRGAEKFTAEIFDKYFTDNDKQE